MKQALTNKIITNKVVTNKLVSFLCSMFALFKTTQKLSKKADNVNSL